MALSTVKTEITGKVWKITAEKGAFSIRAEFGPIEIRKLRIKEEK